MGTEGLGEESRKNGVRPQKENRKRRRERGETRREDGTRPLGRLEEKERERQRERHKG